jgi:hypothetical protein
MFTFAKQTKYKSCASSSKSTPKVEPYLLCEWLDKVIGVGDSLANNGCPNSGNHKSNVLVFVVG